MRCTPLPVIIFRSWPCWGGVSDGCIYSSAKDTYRDTYWAVGHQYRAPTYPLIFRAWDPLFLENDGRSSRFIAIVFKACVDIAFLYSYVEYSQFRASVEVIFWLPLLPVCLALRGCQITSLSYLTMLHPPVVDRCRSWGPTAW